jgi:cellulose synthase/poly-beta-1,6-N-acetylglucosamine synthase-like glycosyltransferase
VAAPPTLSVLLPVRNGQGSLQEALSSIQEQTLEALEILCVDDGSTDGTVEILRRAAREDPRVQVISQEPRGIVGALETARSRARGRYLARMDADDVAHRGRLQAQLDLMEADPRLVATGTGVEYFPRESVRDGALRYEGWINGLSSHEAMVRDLFVECPLPHPTLLLRADAMEWVGGYRDVGWPEDYDLVFRLWEGGGRFGKVPEPLLRWREGPGRLSRTHPAYTEEAFRRCKVHFLLRTHLEEGRGVVIWGAGPVGKAFARELQAQGGTLRAFVDLSPRKHGQEIHGVRVFSPREAGRFKDDFHLAAVAQPGAREEIRGTLARLGMVELNDFVAVG